MGASFPKSVRGSRSNLAARPARRLVENRGRASVHPTCPGHLIAADASAGRRNARKRRNRMRGRIGAIQQLALLLRGRLLRLSEGGSCPPRKNITQFKEFVLWVMPQLRKPCSSRAGKSSNRHPRSWLSRCPPPRTCSDGS